MADTSATDAVPDSPPSKKKGGLISFIKKNKTLAIVVGAGGVFYLYKMNKEKPEGAEAGQPEGEVSAIAQETGAAVGTAETAQFELGRAERTTEQSRQEVEELENDRTEEREKTREREKERETETEPNREPKTEPEKPGGIEPGEQPASASAVTIHGHTFPGATSSHIAKTGKTVGGKDYVEYAIVFPGRIEHWQYFTATGNWRQVSSSANGGGANKSGRGSGDRPPTPTGGPATGPKHKPPKPPRSRPPVAIAPAQPVGAPVSQTHPNAVKTSNRCVNGGVGGHTAPAGYHLFCGSDGWIYRAPNA